MHPVSQSVRSSAVAGRFYPANAVELKQRVAELLRAYGPKAQTKALAVIAPHAGYIYSGAVAAEVFASVHVPGSAVVLCPNHTGLGARRSVWTAGEWRLPGGAVPVDSELALAVCAEAGLTPDEAAHLGEHAIEVQLPFLRERNPDIRVVPICLSHLELSECKRIGDALARVIAGCEMPVLLVASTDMSHYIAAERARQLDAMALDRIRELDPEGLYRVVEERGISMCGYIPTTIALFAARALGAREGEVLRYTNSGEVSGDFARVVGYAGAVVGRGDGTRRELTG